jgi:hypothetical protein
MAMEPTAWNENQDPQSPSSLAMSTLRDCGGQGKGRMLRSPEALAAACPRAGERCGAAETMPGSKVERFAALQEPSPGALQFASRIVRDAVESAPKNASS